MHNVELNSVSVRQRTQRVHEGTRRKLCVLGEKIVEFFVVKKRVTTKFTKQKQRKALRAKEIKQCYADLTDILRSVKIINNHNNQCTINGD